MHTFLHYLLVAAAGGLATSFAEFKFKYNLVDLAVDGFEKAKSFVLGVLSAIKSKV